MLLLIDYPLESSAVFSSLIFLEFIKKSTEIGRDNFFKNDIFFKKISSANYMERQIYQKICFATPLFVSLSRYFYAKALNKSVCRITTNTCAFFRDSFHQKTFFDKFRDIMAIMFYDVK